MAKLIALVAVLAILGLVVVDASIHRTIVTTEIEEIDATGRQQSQKCRQQIQSQDLSHCERFVTQSGPMTFNPEQHRQQCCQQLQKMDEDCRCEALMEMAKKQQQQGQMQTEEMQEMMKRVRSIPTYCRMAGCQWTEEEPMMNGDENPQKQGCRQQIREQDMNKCERFIRQQSGGRRIVMTTSTHEVQGCCQQLSQVDKQCRCEALKEIVRKQQQQGRVGTEEMEEMMQIAQRIPKMCNMEPRTCQWRIVLY